MKRLASILFLTCVLGCSGTIDPNYSEDAQTLAKAMEEVSENDLEIIYKQFSGLAQCLENCPNCLKDTLQVEEVIGRFQEDYGYSAGEYEDFADAFIELMEENGFKQGEESRNIVDKVKDSDKEVSRSDFIEVLQIVADGAKLALENKDADN